VSYACGDVNSDANLMSILSSSSEMLNLSARGKISLLLPGKESHTSQENLAATGYPGSRPIGKWHQI
jgi:hypothetical protein